MTFRQKNAAVALVAVAFASCGGERKEPPSEAASTAPKASPSVAAPTGAAPALAPALLDPRLAKETAPARFRVRFKTTRGDFVVEAVRDWAPRGADRFYNLVRVGFFDDVAFFRVLEGFVAQFGIHGNPRVSQAWRESAIPDDPRGQSNERGTVTFATAGPNTRTTQFFINFRDNRNLDGMGFTPFGRVVEGMEVVDRLYSGYGEGAPNGGGPDQGRAQSEGNAYFKSQFAKLDYIQQAALLPGS